MDNPLQSVLYNELILDNIFRHLSNSDLLLKVNRIALRWNKLASKFVQKRRRITLTEKNILYYANFINEGGVPAKHIELKLDYKSSEIPVKREDVDKIISAFTKIGGNVQNVSVTTSDWDIDIPIVINHSRTVKQANLLCCLLHSCKKVEKLFLNIISTSLFANHKFLTKLLNLTKLEPFLKLQNLSISLPRYCERVLPEFLQAAPNIQEFHPNFDLSLQDFQKIEREFPKLLEKIGTFSNVHGLNERLADFLTTRNFPSLNKLHAKIIKDFPVWEKVLEKFADQWVQLHLNLGVTGNAIDLQPPQLFLPLMKNLEILRLDFTAVGLINPHFAVCRFFAKRGSEMNFPKLGNFYMKFPEKYNSFEDKAHPQNLFEQIALATFKHPPSHPVFPSITRIQISAGATNYVGENALRIKPKVVKGIKKYFPNLEYDFVVDECEASIVVPMLAEN